jgi:hypothetical protein
MQKPSAGSSRPTRGAADAVCKRVDGLVRSLAQIEFAFRRAEAQIIADARRGIRALRTDAMARIAELRAGRGP